MSDLSSQTAKALKWSSITEIVAKMISPIINMVLARILAPEAFGMLATVTMVISFAEVFVESGFQKFLIQHKFDSEQKENEYMSVAFWANLVFSMVVWVLVILFRDSLASLAGNDGLGFPVAITGFTIPLFGIIGIQNCKLKKNLQFKQLFYVRLISSLVPLFVTLPLAIVGLGYWSLIAGNIVGVLARSIVLVAVGRFRPAMYFSFPVLKHMMKFGIWTMLDGVAMWMTNWIDSLLIAHSMSEYYLGLYKNSVTTVTSIFGIITAALTPVLFSALSKLQDDDSKFKDMFLKTQKVLCVFLLPIGFGVFFYRDLVTLVLFGEAWSEAANIVGIMAITTALRTIFISLNGDAYRAKGKFYIPLVRQLVDLAILIPICVLSVQNGFWSLVYARAFVKLDLVVLDIVFMWFICKISPKDTSSGIMPSAIATGVMVIAIFALRILGTSVVWSLISILMCIIIYFAVLFCFRAEREILLVPAKKLYVKKCTKK